MLWRRASSWRNPRIHEKLASSQFSKIVTRKSNGSAWLLLYTLCLRCASCSYISLWAHGSGNYRFNTRHKACFSPPGFGCFVLYILRPVVCSVHVFLFPKHNLQCCLNLPLFPQRWSITLIKALTRTLKRSTCCCCCCWMHACMNDSHSVGILYWQYESI